MLQLLSSKPTWYLSSGSSADDKQRLAIVKKDLFNNAHSASVFLNANTSQHFAQPVPDFSARGDFTNRSFFIYRGAAPVAEVSQSTIKLVIFSSQNAVCTWPVLCAALAAFLILVCISGGSALLMW